MNRIATLSLALILASATSNAQISVGQNEMPHAGDNLYRTHAVISPLANYAATGPAHTWDFSTLQANGPDTSSYISVASTNFVYAIVYADIFFNPNRANVAKRGVDIAFNNLLPIVNPYTFNYRSPSVYKTVGFGADLAGIPVPIIFTQPDVIYNLPLNYTDAGSSFSSWNVSLPTLAYYGYQQTRDNLVDGWGAITTPGGTFDVLRVKTTIMGKDTIHVDTLGIGFAINRPIAHEYKWLAQGLRVPVLQINTTTLFGFEVINNIWYYDVPRSIMVVAPLANTICPGATVDVHYDETGAFNSGGFLIPANVFTAQLSDASGSFATPVNIGSVTATTSGTITAIIPMGTPLGSGYRIRVVSNSPAFIGSDNGSDITIGGATTASITSSGTTMICTGSSVMFTAVGGPSYQWQESGADIPGETNATYNASTAGVYSVVVNNACGSATSNTLTVTVNDPPQHVIDPLTYVACAGTSVDITAQDMSGQSPLTYQWSLNNAPIVGATNIGVSASLAGAYTLEVTNTNTGCTFTTAAATVTVESVATPTVTASGSTTFCTGGSVTLNTTAVPGLTYQWYQDGTMIPGATDVMLAVSDAGAYTLIATSANNCVSAPSAAINVVVNTVPNAPSITASEPTTFCEGNGVTLIANVIPDVTYQWSQDGADLVGDTATQLQVNTAGSYTVTVTSVGGCSASAIPVLIVVNPLPPAPVITQGGDTLYATGTGTFQWTWWGNPVPGATNSWLVPDASGDYAVSVSDGNGCSNTSTPYTYISTGIGGSTGSITGIFPNPTDGAFVIMDANANIGDPYVITDAAGRTVLQGALTGSRTAIDMHSAAKGIYVMRTISNGRTNTARIVID